MRLLERATRRSIMKRTRLLVLTLCTVALTGAMIVHQSSRGVRSASPAVHADDPYSSPAAYRCKRCQPHHWRACMLQH